MMVQSLFSNTPHPLILYIYYLLAGQTPSVKVVSVSVDKKITVDSTITITAELATAVDISGGSIAYEAELGSVKLASGTEDLCSLSKSVLPCPIATTPSKTLTYTVKLPAIVVAGTYHATLTGTDSANNHLFCIKADVVVHLFATFRESNEAEIIDSKEVVAAPAADACTYATQDACNAVAECRWCICHALPSSCHTLEQAKKLPPSVFDCGLSAPTTTPLQKDKIILHW
jgi:hypothetical protein